MTAIGLAEPSIPSSTPPPILGYTWHSYWDWTCVRYLQVNCEWQQLVWLDEFTYISGDVWFSLWLMILENTSKCHPCEKSHEIPIKPVYRLMLMTHMHINTIDTSLLERYRLMYSTLLILNMATHRKNVLYLYLCTVRRKFLVANPTPKWCKIHPPLCEK